MTEIEKNKLNQVLFSNDELNALCEQILEETKRAGADAASVNIATNKGFSVSAHNKEVETVEYHQDKVIEITAYIGKRTGSASISDIRLDAIRAAAEAACHIAKFTDEDEASGLAEKDELALHYSPLNLNFPWPLSVDEAIKLACLCEQEALAYDKRIMSAEDVTIATYAMMHAYANTNGFIGSYPYTRHDISCVLVAKEGDEMQRDYSYTVSPNPSKLKSISEIAKESAQRTVKRLGARRLRTMKAPVIFLAEEARGLLGHFVAAISGGNLYRKSSFLLDQIDQAIFPSFIHIKEHPHLADGLGSAPFDDDGVATRANVFVENGILRQYSLGVYSARKLGMRTTGNAGGVHNLSISTQSKNLKDLLKTMNKGLLITEMMGQGVNIVTGDYSRGVGGYWVEDGEIQYPVQEITVASRLQDIYSRIVEISNDIDVRGNIHTGSILIEEMMIAGT